MNFIFWNIRRKTDDVFLGHIVKMLNENFGNILEAELTEQDGRTYLRTNLFDHIATLHCGLIDSDVLGCAFEPEQRFESPDGSAITFDRDYFGSHRGLRILPGPFAAREDADRPLW